MRAVTAGTPPPKPPDGQPGELTAHDGLRLRYALWPPAPGAPLKGTVCLFGGRSEFIEKYFETIGELRKRGFAVASMDWRGQGGSGRVLKNWRRGHIDTFDLYDRDLAQFMNEVVLPDSPAPYFALAHSMGGNILLRTAVSRTVWFDRMVLSAPMLRLVTGLPPGFVRRVAEVATYLGLGNAYLPASGDTIGDTASFKRNVRTRDARRYARNAAIVDAHPNLGLGGPTVQWLVSAFDAMDIFEAPDFPQQVTIPVMMFGASDDVVVETRMIERLASQLRGGAFMLLPHARHEIVMDRDEVLAQFWAAFDAFIPGTPVPGRGRFG